MSNKVSGERLKLETELLRFRLYALAVTTIFKTFGCLNCGTAFIARRLNWKKEKLLALLCAPEKFELDDLSDVLLAMGMEPRLKLKPRPPAITRKKK